MYVRMYVCIWNYHHYKCVLYKIKHMKKLNSENILHHKLENMLMSHMQY